LEKLFRTSPGPDFCRLVLWCSLALLTNPLFPFFFAFVPDSHPPRPFHLASTGCPTFFDRYAINALVFFFLFFLRAPFLPLVGKPVFVQIFFSFPSSRRDPFGPFFCRHSTPFLIAEASWPTLSPGHLVPPETGTFAPPVPHGLGYREPAFFLPAIPRRCISDPSVFRFF